VLGNGGTKVFKKYLYDISKSLKGGHQAAAIVMHDIQRGMVMMRQNTARLFARGHIKYSGIVHNQPKMDSMATLIEDSVIYLKHHGYDLSFKEMQEKKTKRTLPLVLKWMEQEPECLHPHFYLVQIYMESGHPEKAIEHGEIYLKNRKTLEESGIQNFNKSIYYTMFSAYMRLGKIDEANRWLTEGMKHDPVNLDLAFALVQFGVKVGQTHLIYLGANQYMMLHDKMKADPMLRQNMFMFSCNPESYSYCLYHLALSQFKLGMEAIARLKNIVTDASDLYRNGLMADLKSELFDMGMCDFARKHIHFDQVSITPSLVEELMAKSPEIFH
jgi:tetratricopeptide (TPR) repeat protein